MAAGSPDSRGNNRVMGGLRELLSSPAVVLSIFLADAAAQHHPSVAEPLLGRNLLSGVTAGHFKRLFPAHAPALGAPGQIKSSILLVVLLDQGIINSLSSHECLI